MPLETVRLDRVFGVVQTSQNREQVTLFGFESANRKEYSVAAPGKPRIESGMTITAYLAEAGNWHTLIGWRDHENGAIVCKPEGRPIFLCVWSVLGFCMAARGVWDRSIMLSAWCFLLLYSVGASGIFAVCGEPAANWRRRRRSAMLNTIPRKTAYRLMNEVKGSSSLISASWEGPAAASTQPRAFKYVAEGTTVATGCIKTKEGDLSEHNESVKRHRELAMIARR
jgi:hypothetical protein